MKFHDSGATVSLGVPDPPQQKATLSGKPVIVFGKEGDAHSTIEQVQELLKEQPTFFLLQHLSALANHVASTDAVPLVDNVPVTTHAVACLALLAVEASNDFQASDRPINQAYIARLFDMFWHLHDPIKQEDPAGAAELLFRMGDHQFLYQAELCHQLPRMLLIFRDIWPTVPLAAEVRPLEAFHSTVGLPWEDAILLGMAAIGRSQSSGVIAPETLIAKDAGENAMIRRIFTAENWERFLSWTSGDYQTIRAAGQSTLPPSPEYLQFRFNPLRTLPIVRPAWIPAGYPRDVVILPVWRLLFERMTLGTYHLLADLHNAGGKTNPFRVAFGYVFQEYIGRLLHEAVKTGSVSPEWKYDSDTAKDVDSPDWVVSEPDGVVVVEVKQSSTFLEARQWGSGEAVRADLKKTLVKAMQQLARFKNAVDGSKNGTQHLHGRPMQHVVVSFDRISFGNTVVRDAIEEVVASTGGTKLPIHVMSVEEFEYLLAGCGKSSLFSLLQRKQQSEREDRMDFRDWLTTVMKGDFPRRNPFLSARYAQFLASNGLPAPVST